MLKSRRKYQDITNESKLYFEMLEVIHRHREAGAPPLHMIEDACFALVTAAAADRVDIHDLSPMLERLAAVQQEAAAFRMVGGVAEA